MKGHVSDNLTLVRHELTNGSFKLALHPTVVCSFAHGLRVKVHAFRE